MKRSIILFVTLLVLSLAAHGQTTMDVKIGNISISVPSGWIAQYSDTTIIFILYSPIEENDTFQENVNLTTETLPSKYSEKGYLTAATENLKSLYKDFKIIESKDNYHVFTGIINDKLLQQMQFVQIKDNVAYVVTYTATPDSFDRYVKIFNQIQQTFKY